MQAAQNMFRKKTTGIKDSALISYMYTAFCKTTRKYMFLQFRPFIPEAEH